VNSEMKTTKFNWECAHCQHRNIQPVKFQFDIPKYYEAVWICSKCSKNSKIEFDYKVRKNFQ